MLKFEGNTLPIEVFNDQEIIGRVKLTKDNNVVFETVAANNTGDLKPVSLDYQDTRKLLIKFLEIDLGFVPALVIDPMGKTHEGILKEASAVEAARHILGNTKKGTK